MENMVVPLLASLVLYIYIYMSSSTASTPRLSEMEQVGSRWGPVAAMLAVDMVLAVMNILVKKSLDRGLHCLVLITVRQAIGAAFIAPFAYFKERNSRPRMTWWIATQFFFSSLLGVVLTQYLFFVGLRYTNVTFACAFVNMAPVFTFLFALPLRQEKLSLKNTAGKAKLLATIVCVGGVLVLMFYKGPLLGSSHTTQLSEPVASVGRKAAVRWTAGSIALLGGSLCWSAWFIMQAKIGKQYPAVYSGTTFTFFLATLQAAALALTMMRGSAVDVWTSSLSGWLQMVTVLFAGVVGSGICFLVMSWSIAKRGPVFTVAFSPLIQVVVAIIDFILTRQPPHLGSVLGSVFVVLGLYLLLWGKSREAGCCEVKPIQETSPKGGVAGSHTASREDV